MAELETELTEIRNRYALATAAAKVGVWDWNLDTGEFYLDPNVKNLLGYADEEIPNDIEVWSGYVHPDDKQAVMKAAQDVIDGRTQEYRFEHRMQHRDGSVRWFMVRGSLLRDSEDKPVRFIGTDTDITERKLLEERIDELSSEIEAQFSHDLHDGLGQELTGLALLLKTLEKKVASGDSSLESDLRQANDIVNHAIEETGTLARGLSPVLKSRELADVLRKLAKRTESVLGIECRATIAANLPNSLNEGYANHLYRIAQEAITNAAKHGQATRVDLSCEVVDRLLTLTISDDGTGIPEPTPMTQGMGLRIMDHRARSIGGNLSISRLKEGGTIIVCSCPIQK